MARLKSLGLTRDGLRLGNGRQFRFLWDILIVDSLNFALNYLILSVE